MARPLRKIVVHVHDARTIEDVARGPERFGHRRRVAEIEQGGECQPHLAAVVRNRGAATPASHLAWKGSFRRPLLTVVEAKLFSSRDEPNVAFVKDGGPLHRRAVKPLAVATVAYLRVERICIDLVSNRTAVTLRPVLQGEALVVDRPEARSEAFAFSFDHWRKDSALAKRYCMRIR